MQASAEARRRAEPFTPVCPVLLGRARGKATSLVGLAFLPRQPSPGGPRGSEKDALGTLKAQPTESGLRPAPRRGQPRSGCAPGR